MGPRPTKERGMKRIGMIICAAAILVAGIGFLVGCNDVKADSVKHLYVISPTDCKVLIHTTVPDRWILCHNGGGVVSGAYGMSEGKLYGGANMIVLTYDDLGLKVGDTFTSFSPVTRSEK